MQLFHSTFRVVYGWFGCCTLVVLSSKSKTLTVKSIRTFTVRFMYFDCLLGVHPIGFVSNSDQNKTKQVFEYTLTRIYRC